MVTKIMILAIFALSLELLVGVTGLVSSATRRSSAWRAMPRPSSRRRARPARVWLLLAAACSPRRVRARGRRAVVRTKGVYFIMVTLAFAQMVYYLFHDNKLGGGTDGIYINFKP